MQVLSLIQKNNLPFNFALGKELGVGADGQCFELNDKVIKLSVLFDSSSKDYHKIQNVLEFMINKQPDSCVRVYEYGYIGKGYRPFIGAPDNKQKFIIYYYIMDKLYKISDDEKKVFHTIISHNDSGNKKNFPLNKIKNILMEVNGFLDFDFNKIFHFCESLKKCPIDQNDIHERNIMKDQFGNFKLIDFDRGSIKEKYVAG